MYKNGYKCRDLQKAVVAFIWSARAAIDFLRNQTVQIPHIKTGFADRKVSQECWALP